MAQGYGKEAGCEDISMGIESSDPEILKIIKKRRNNRADRKAEKAAKKYFNKVNGYFIIGLPGSSYEKDLASVNWSQNKWVLTPISATMSRPKKG